jgi:hypothetical protein
MFSIIQLLFNAEKLSVKSELAAGKPNRFEATDLPDL